MRIMIDIDGTISELKKQGQTYNTVRANEGAVAHIKALKKAGHYIILQTARHMKTCGGDQGQVVAKIGKQTLDWLQDNQVPYDEIYFGKPYADVYLDDLAHPFTSWEEIIPSVFDDKKINILIPMAGAGSRFANAGFTDPKPLIPVHGKKMIEWALASFGELSSSPHVSLIFVILQEHEQKYKLTGQLKTLFGKKIQIIILDKIEPGQAATCLKASALINNYNQLIIYNCDTYTTGNEQLLKIIESERPDGVIACFKAKHPRYSYVRLDKAGYVTETKEKEVISNLATTGLYYFRRGRDFVTAAKKMVTEGETAKGEYFVAPVYNELLKSGKKIRTYLAEDNWVLGTPEELKVFKDSYNK